MLFGVSIDKGEEGTRFLAVSAGSEAEVRELLALAGAPMVLEIDLLEELLWGQYQGLAVLGTV